MIDDLEQELAAVPQDCAAFQDKIAVVTKLAARKEQDQRSKSAEGAASLDVEDVETVLTGWIGDNLYSLNNLVITFSKLDSELGLPLGSSAAHLQRVAEAAGAKLLHRAAATILLDT